MARNLTAILLIMLWLVPLTSLAEDPLRNKALRKEYQQSLKRFMDEGWTAWEQTRSLEDVVRRYYFLRGKAGPFADLLETCAIGRTSNEAMRHATHKAATQYVRLQNSRIEGTSQSITKNEVTADTVASTLSFDSSFRLQSAESVSLPRPALALSRPTPEGKIEVLLLYIIHQ